MSEHFGEEQSEETPVIRQMRERIDSLSEKASKVDQLEQRLAGYEAREKLNSQVEQMGLDGDQRGRFIKMANAMLGDDLSDTEKVRNLATEYGFLAPEPQAVQEAQAMDRAAGLAHGAQAPAVGTPEDLDRQIAEAKTPEEVIALSRQRGTPIAE